MSVKINDNGSRRERIHMVGIKGVGMTALAELLRPTAIITGSDTKEIFFTDAVLRRLKIPVSIFNRKNVSRDIDRVIYSSAYASGNKEVETARRLSIPTQPYAEALADFFNTKDGIAVTGTHGKTTTTAMIGTMMEACGADPTVLVGAKVISWGRNARIGRSRWMVAEADEYQNKFLLLRPKILVITNIEYDHPDFFKTRAAYTRAFKMLVASMPKDGLIIAERSVKEHIKNAPCRIVWYGLKGAVRGRYRELNGEAARTLARELHFPMQKVDKALREFQGTARRLERYPYASSRVLLYDDYAHHPTEVRATLSMLRVMHPRSYIITVFHPHTYSRTQALMKDFARAFDDADEVALLPVYASMREHAEDFPADMQDRFLRLMKKHHAHGVAFPTHESVAEYLKSRLHELPEKKHIIIVTMGAGDVWRVLPMLGKGRAKKRE